MRRPELAVAQHRTGADPVLARVDAATRAAARAIRRRPAGGPVVGTAAAGRRQSQLIRVEPVERELVHHGEETGAGERGAGDHRPARRGRRTGQLREPQEGRAARRVGAVVEQVERGLRSVVGQRRLHREAALASRGVEARREGRQGERPAAERRRLVDDPHLHADEAIRRIREHVVRERDPGRVHAESGKVGPVRVGRIGVDRIEAPDAGRVVRRGDREEDLRGRRPGIRIGDRDPAPGERVVDHVRIERAAAQTGAAREESRERNGAEDSAGLVLDAHLRVEHRHQVVRSDRTHRVRWNGDAAVGEGLEARAGQQVPDGLRHRSRRARRGARVPGAVE